MYVLDLALLPDYWSLALDVLGIVITMISCGSNCCAWEVRSERQVIPTDICDCPCWECHSEVSVGAMSYANSLGNDHSDARLNGRSKVKDVEVKNLNGISLIFALKMS